MLENKTIQGMTDLEFAAHVLQRKLDKAQNPNTPFAAKLQQTIIDLRHRDEAERQRMKNSWAVQYYDTDGEPVRSVDMETWALTQVAELILRGYATGIFTRPLAYKGQADAAQETRYVYYTIMRPPMPGGVPKGAIEYKDFGERTYVSDIERTAWGYVVYDRPLTEDEIWEYELQRAVA